MIQRILVGTPTSNESPATLEAAAELASFLRRRAGRTAGRARDRRPTDVRPRRRPRPHRPRDPAPAALPGPAGSQPQRTRQRRSQRVPGGRGRGIPLLVRVVVALGTGEAQAEEHLGRVVHELLGALAAPCTRRSAGLRVSSPVAAEDVADELVVRLVGGDRLADPVVEGERAVRPDPAGCARLTRRTSAHLLAK